MFVTTALACALFVLITRVFEKMTDIEKHVRSLENLLERKHEHVMKCILYKAVCVCEPIHGLKIECGDISFTDVRILDKNDNEVVFKINRHEKQDCGYRKCSHDKISLKSTAEDRMDLIIEFEPVMFKYIEFDDVSICNTKRIFIDLLGYDKQVHIKREFLKKEKKTSSYVTHHVYDV